jgi:hypothetical protein
MDLESGRSILLQRNADRRSVFHAREHLWELGRKLHPNDESGQSRWMMVHRDLPGQLQNQKAGDLRAVYSNTRRIRNA